MFSSNSAPTTPLDRPRDSTERARKRGPQGRGRQRRCIQSNAAASEDGNGSERRETCGQRAKAALICAHDDEEVEVEEEEE